MSSTLILREMQGPLGGTLASMLLYGIICMQVSHYVSNYASSDRQALKWLVGIIWVLESIHTFLSIHFIRYYLILHFDDPQALSHVVWSMGATYISGFIVACVVDLFLVWRIWKLSNRVLIPIFLGLLATIRTGATSLFFLRLLLNRSHLSFHLLAVGIGNAVLGLKFTEVVVFLAKVHPTMVAGWTLSAFADSLIAVALCYFLYKQRSGMERTDRIIKTLLMYTINTGALTSLFAILVIITFLKLKGTMYFTAFVQVQSKPLAVYAVSLLASLNARQSNEKNRNPSRSLPCRYMKTLTSNSPQDQLSESQAVIQIQREADVTVEMHRKLSITLNLPTAKLDV